MSLIPLTKADEQNVALSTLSLDSSDLLTTPKEVVIKILSFLNPLKLPDLSLVSKQMGRLVAESIPLNAVLNACEGYRELLVRACAKNLSAQPNKTLAVKLVTTSPATQKTKREFSLPHSHIKQLEESLHAKLENKQLSLLQKETIKVLGYTHAQLVDLLHFIKNPEKIKIFQILQSFEEEYFNNCLNNTFCNEKNERCIQCDNTEINLNKIYVSNLRKLNKSFTIEEGIEALPRLSKEINERKKVCLPEGDSSRKELAIGIASLLATSEICLGCEIRIPCMGTGIKESDTISNFHRQKVLSELPDSEKKLFLLEKAKIIENSKISDEQLKEIVTMAKDVKNLKALEALEELLLVETISYFYNDDNSEGQLESHVKKTCHEIVIEKNKACHRQTAITVAAGAVAMYFYFYLNSKGWS